MTAVHCVYHFWCKQLYVYKRRLLTKRKNIGDGEHASCWPAGDLVCRHKNVLGRHNQLTLSSLGLPLSSSSTTSRELLSQFSMGMKMIWCGLKIQENWHVLVNQLHGNFLSKTLSFRKINYVFMNVKWCFNASWGLKGLKLLCRIYGGQFLFNSLSSKYAIWSIRWTTWNIWRHILSVCLSGCHILSKIYYMIIEHHKCDIVALNG